MEMDFSSLNLQYLLQVRDIARCHPELAVAILGLSKEMVSDLSAITGDDMSMITRSKAPLLTLRGDCRWWSNLFTALKDNQPGEVEVVLEHANLSVVIRQ
ncbi:MAG: hypothetical protein GY696_24635 [Gammaproteobacteria bacterium]|nr:hypothetical protein [Gammaproteobacteria bacterium]